MAGDTIEGDLPELLKAVLAADPDVFKGLLLFFEPNITIHCVLNAQLYDIRPHLKPNCKPLVYIKMG